MTRAEFEKFKEQSKCIWDDIDSIDFKDTKTKETKELEYSAFKAGVSGYKLYNETTIIS